MDRFLHTAILYFVAFFQLQALQRSKKAASRAECAALKREMHHHLQELSPIYATIIMQESDYHHTQQDKKFFEGLYETTTEILMQAFQGQRRQAILEEELGRVLRTNQFNTLANRRRSAGHISQSSLTVRELYALKHEGDPSLNSRTLANLYQKKANQGSVTLASVSNSPLIGNVISSDDGDDGSNTTRRNKKQSGNPNSRPQTASDEVRASFISFSREQLSSTPQQKHKIDQKQRNKFDEGMHRGLPSRGNSAASGSSFLQSRESSSRGTHPRMSSIPDETVTGSEFTPAPFTQDQTSTI